MSRVRLIHGDALDTLATLDAGTFDACLTDPPYGLKFMGRRWDHGVPSSEVWREVLRCLRPGASLMAFGGTRTYHRLAVAVEDAGFEIRDSVLVPGVAWCYGSGFPKSLSVGKAVGGVRVEQAPRWINYGTALKPSWEPVVWAMKPVDGTFARNALEHGVAGLNVHVGRVAANGDKLGGGAEKRDLGNHGWDRPWRKDPEAQAAHAERVRANVQKAEVFGRFPANLILAHLPSCRLDGTKRVSKGGGDGPASATRVHGEGTLKLSGDDGARLSHYDPDGTEEVAAWQCVEGCPVLAMDRASGELTSNSGEPFRRNEDKFRNTYNTFQGTPTEQGFYGDSGTASRFFQQVAWEPGEFERTLLYYAKAATAERMVDGERLLHPTMKPLALATYLAKMLLPPPRVDGQPRRLLVPYSGVGSEVIGALRAGWDEVVAIELDADEEGWIEKSARRIEADAPLFNVVEVTP